MTTDEEVKELKIKSDKITQKIKSIKSGVDNLFPIIDGIINIENYVKSEDKILWILKESNERYDPKTGNPVKKIGGWSLTGAINEGKEWKDQPKTGRTVLKRIMIISYIVQNKLTDFNMDAITGYDLNNPDFFNALKSIALINIKKIPGNTRAKQLEIQKAYNEHKILLKEQIETYNPNIIICGNTLQYFSQDNYFVKNNRKKLEHGEHHYYPLQDRIYIQSYHPAYRPNDNNFEKKYIEKIIKAVIDWKNIYGNE
jgi:hypothetical protein